MVLFLMSKISVKAELKLLQFKENPQTDQILILFDTLLSNLFLSKMPFILKQIELIWSQQQNCKVTNLYSFVIISNQIQEHIYTYAFHILKSNQKSTCQMDNKPKLCRFKENCSNFMANKACNFEHVQCKYNNKCNKKQTCMFYHVAGESSNFNSKPINNKPIFNAPKSQTLCQFDGRCTKSNCLFKHEIGRMPQDKNNAPSQSSFNPKPFGQNSRLCRFGLQCKKLECRYQHPERQNQPRLQSGNIGNLNQNQVRRQGGQYQQASLQGHSQNNQRQQNRYCFDFILSNNCKNGQSCQKPHQFNQKSSFKRIFFTNEIPSKNFNIVFYEHEKSGQQRNNKDLVYAVQQNDQISFRKLISSQNLYKDYGGIGPNQLNKTYLRVISSQLFKAEAVIQGIEAFQFNRSEFLVFLSGQKIYIYNTTKGEVNTIGTQKMNNKLTGCTLIPRKETLLIATSQENLRRLQFNPQKQTFQIKSFVQGVPCHGFKTLKCSDSQLLGESIIYGVNNQSTKVILINKQLRSSAIQFPSGAFINDLEVCLIANVIPACFVSVSTNRVHQIIAINLLNFQQHEIMRYESSLGINRIFSSEGHMLIEIKNKGLLIYKLNEFEKDIGMIPLLNQIQQIRKDNKGNVLVLQSSSVDSKGSISIFKVKKI